MNLEQRKTGIGGSDVAALLNLSPWRTPTDVWLDKVGDLIGYQRQDEPTLSMEIGTALEQTVADLYARQMGVELRRQNVQCRKGHIIGNIDRLVMPGDGTAAAYKGEVRAKKILECKTSSVEWENGEVPPYYMVQCLQYIGLCPTVETCDIACLFFTFGKDFKVYTVERNDEVISDMFAQEEEFWAKYVQPTLDHPDNPTPPPAVNETDCQNKWRFARRRESPAVKAFAQAEDLSLVSDLKTVREQIKELEGQESEIRTKLIDRLVAQNADTLVDFDLDADGNRIIARDGTEKTHSLITWRQGKGREVIDWKGLAASLNIPKETVQGFTTVKDGAFTFRLAV